MSGFFFPAFSGATVPLPVAPPSFPSAWAPMANGLRPAPAPGGPGDHPGVPVSGATGLPVMGPLRFASSQAPASGDRPLRSPAALGRSLGRSLGPLGATVPLPVAPPPMPGAPVGGWQHGWPGPVVHVLGRHGARPIRLDVEMFNEKLVQELAEQWRLETCSISARNRDEYFADAYSGLKPLIRAYAEQEGAMLEDLEMTSEVLFRIQTLLPPGNRSIDEILFWATVLINEMHKVSKRLVLLRRRRSRSAPSARSDSGASSSSRSRSR